MSDLIERAKLYTESAQDMLIAEHNLIQAAKMLERVLAFDRETSNPNGYSLGWHTITSVEDSRTYFGAYFTPSHYVDMGYSTKIEGRDTEDTEIREVSLRDGQITYLVNEPRIRIRRTVDEKSDTKEPLVVVSSRNDWNIRVAEKKPKQQDSVVEGVQGLALASAVFKIVARQIGGELITELHTKAAALEGNLSQ